MNPEIWGPHLWHVMHVVALTYPDYPSNIQKKQYRTFYESLQYTIPCLKCKENYINHLAEKPINLNSRIELFVWTVDIHNMVNKILNKPQLTSSEAMKHITESYRHENFIEHFNSKGITKKKGVVGFIIVIVILILIIVVMSVFLIKKYRK